MKKLLRVEHHGIKKDNFEWQVQGVMSYTRIQKLRQQIGSKNHSNIFIQRLRISNILQIISEQYLTLTVGNKIDRNE